MQNHRSYCTIRSWREGEISLGGRNRIGSYEWMVEGVGKGRSNGQAEGKEDKEREYRERQLKLRASRTVVRKPNIVEVSLNMYI